MSKLVNLSDVFSWILKSTDRRPTKFGQGIENWNIYIWRRDIKGSTTTSKGSKLGFSVITGLTHNNVASYQLLSKLKIDSKVTTSINNVSCCFYNRAVVIQSHFTLFRLFSPMFYHRGKTAQNWRILKHPSHKLFRWKLCNSLLGF